MQYIERSKRNLKHWRENIFNGILVLCHSQFAILKLGVWAFCNFPKGKDFDSGIKKKTQKLRLCFLHLYFLPAALCLYSISFYSAP